MPRIFIQDTEEGKICLCARSSFDINRLLANGATELTEEQIEAYGLKGHEHEVSPSTTKVNEDGTVTFTPPEKYEPTNEELLEAYEHAVQAALDSFAQTKGYDNIASACGYYNSANAKYAAEAAYCTQLRDSTWEQFYAIANTVVAERPGRQAFLDMLPVGSAAWPE